MVDLTKPCDEYDKTFFENIEKELATYPSFWALQEKFVSVGEYLKINTASFISFADNWKKAQKLIYGCHEEVDSRPTCSQSEKRELLELFLTQKQFPSSPSEVFSIF